MTVRARGRPARSDDAAVSSVLGAILVFGLMVMALVVVQVRFVPVWDEEREARHMQDLTTQLGQVKSDLDRQVDNRTDVSISNPVTLQDEGGFRFFTGAKVPAKVGFEPSPPGTGFTISSPKMTILQSGDQSFLGLADQADWVPIASTEDVIDEVVALRALRMRIDMHEDVCSTYQSDDTATLVVTDADGDEVGRTVATWLPSSSAEWALKLDVFANFDNGAVADDQVSSDTEFFFQQLCQGSQENFLDYHYFDLLDPALLFDAVVESAEFPITLTLDEDGLVASYVIVYDEASPGGGSTTVGSLGAVVEPYAPAPFPAGALVIEALNQRYTQQTYVLEHGALLRVQDGVAAMAVPPTFRIGQSALQTSIEWAIPSLQGSTGGLSGSDTATVVSTPDAGRIDILATAATIEVVIPTAYPAAWEDFLDRELREAGLVASSGYSLTPAAAGDSLTFSLIGVSTDANVADLFLNLRQANISLELRSSG